jgi:thermitase
MTLRTRAVRIHGEIVVDLWWSGAKTPTVEVWRNGTKLMATQNDGVERDYTGKNGDGSFTYKVCEPGGSAMVCSPFSNASP